MVPAPPGWTLRGHDPFGIFSASPDLLRQGSESLAGRIAYLELDGFAVDEVSVESIDQLWRRGGFPLSFLADSETASVEWRHEFVRSFLERDLPQLGFTTSATTMRRFWTMLAHTHGQTLNASALARSFGVADTTVRRYLDMLTSTFVVRQLLPWHANIRKRQVKAPKVYLSDSGLLHSLLGINDQEDLLCHPLLGASWEGFVIEAVRRHLGVRHDECFFWATHAGAEIDLIVARGRRRLGFEIKRTVAPTVTRSMRIALESLELEHITVVHAGDETYPMAEGITAVALHRLWSDLKPLA